MVGIPTTHPIMNHSQAGTSVMFESRRAPPHDGAPSYHRYLGTPCPPRRGRKGTQGAANPSLNRKTNKNSGKKGIPSEQLIAVSFHRRVLFSQLCHIRPRECVELIPPTLCAHLSVVPLPGLLAAPCTPLCLLYCLKSDLLFLLQQAPRIRKPLRLTPIAKHLLGCSPSLTPTHTHCLSISRSRQKK